MNRIKLVASLITTLLLLACTPSPTSSPGSTSRGALNPAVTQQTIHTTICAPGWAATIRPPNSYTSALKRKQIAEMHLSGTPADYEEDHILPLELGGAPKDPKNLEPQLWAAARVKDRLENSLHQKVCAKVNPLSLSEAQREVVAK